MRQRFKYAWIPGMSGNGTCIGSSTVIASRTSPAFHNPKEVVNSSLYSTWTQSRPGVASVRLFLIASPGQQWLTLAIGLIILIISIVIICLFKAHSKQIFNLADLSSTSSQSEWQSISDPTNELIINSIPYYKICPYRRFLYLSIVFFYRLQAN